MSKQTRLNFSSKAISAPSKRRKLNSNDETQEMSDNSLQQSKKAGGLSSETVDQTELESSSPSGTTNTKTRPSSNPSSKTSTLEASSNSETMNPQNETAPIASAKPSSPLNENKPRCNPHVTLTYQKASLFSAPPATLLCHATNAQGTWGAGIAAAFKKSYPAAFKLYAAHCSAWDSNSLLGTTFLIPPQKRSATKAEQEAEHWIGCLFTSEKKGKGKGSKESILAATGEAVEDLVRKVKAVNEAVAGPAQGKSQTSAQDRIAEVRMCKINSGLFGVPWEATSGVIEAVEVGEGDIEEIAVFSMD